MPENQADFFLSPTLYPGDGCWPNEQQKIGWRLKPKLMPLLFIFQIKGQLLVQRCQAYRFFGRPTDLSDELPTYRYFAGYYRKVYN